MAHFLGMKTQLGVEVIQFKGQKILLTIKTLLQFQISIVFDCNDLDFAQQNFFLNLVSHARTDDSKNLYHSQFEDGILPKQNVMQ